MMNKRKYKKKIRRDIINKFYSISPKKNDLIVMEFDRDRICVRELYNLYKFISKNIGNYKVISLPSITRLKTMNNEELLECRKFIDDILNKMSNKIKEEL